MPHSGATSTRGRSRVRVKGARVPLFSSSLPVEGATVAFGPACGCPFDPHRCPFEGHACRFDVLACPFLVQHQRFRGEAWRVEGHRCRFFRHRCRSKGQRRRFEGQRCSFFRHRCRSEGQRRHFQGHRRRRAVGGAGKGDVASKAGATRMRWRVGAHCVGGGFGPVDRPEGRACSPGKAEGRTRGYSEQHASPPVPGARFALTRATSWIGAIRQEHARNADVLPYSAWQH